MLLLLLSLLTPSTFARCKEPATSEELLKTARAATRAFGESSIAGLQSTMARAIGRVPCLDEVLSGDAAAALYQAQALQAFLDRDYDAVLTNFQLARDLSPSLELALEVAPNGHPLRQLWDQALLSPAFGTRDFDPPRLGALFVDGIPMDALPADRPMLLQWMADNGQPRRSWYLPMASELPPVISGERAQVWSRGLGVASVGAATLAGGLWVAAGLNYSGYAQAGDVVAESQGPPTSTQRTALEALVRRTNTLGLGAQVSTGLALGLGFTSIAIRF